MRRKRTAEKLNQIVADNDFVTEAYEKKDQVLQKRDFFIEKYIKIQKKSLNLWKMYDQNCLMNKWSNANIYKIYV